MNGGILPPHGDGLHAVAIGLIFVPWAIYAPLLRPIGRGSLNIQLVMIEKTAAVLTESVKSINNGIRGFYFAVAARAIASYVDALERLAV